MHISAIGTILLATTQLSFAWLPGEEVRILDKDGFDLFDVTSQVLAGRSIGTSSITWLSSHKIPIRGVNLGSTFVFEPWSAWDKWVQIGCTQYASEVDCGRAKGQAGINAAMSSHWQTYYSASDFVQMAQAGLNAVRIPIGFWIREDLPDRSPAGLNEIFAQGGLAYLKQYCNWAANAGLYIILDLHGAPGAQQPTQPSTGYNAVVPNFYTPSNFERALKFLEWLATQVHTDYSFRSVGAIEVLNEPIQDPASASTTTMRAQYYPAAVKRIRAAEAALKVPASQKLDIMFMDALWWSGNPNQYLNLNAANSTGLSYDDHRYIKWGYNQPQTKAAFQQAACTTDSGYDIQYGNSPVVIGEWSLSAPADYSSQDNPVWTPSGANTPWYLLWFANQAKSYEKVAAGWLYWSWKTQQSGGDPRWSYLDGMKSGLIPKNVSAIYQLANCP